MRGETFFQHQNNLIETNQNDRADRIAVKVINHLGDGVMKMLGIQCVISELYRVYQVILYFQYNLIQLDRT